MRYPCWIMAQPPPVPGSGATWLSLMLTSAVDAVRTDAHSLSNDMLSPAT